MSELHFDAEGEPAKVPGDAEELRVRRFRKPGERGACEVVHGADGAPLYVPADASYLEFRKLVDGVPGRYRLDPVDAGRKVITSAVPLYVTIEALRNNAGAGAADSVTVELLRANVEMMRANVEMTKQVTDRLAQMMTATAEILRAADGAGLPRREPPPAPPPRDDDDEDEDDEDDDDDEGDDERSGMGPLTATLAQLAEQAFPLFESYIADRLAARRRAETAAAAPAAAMPVATAAPVAADAPVATAARVAADAPVAIAAPVADAAPVAVAAPAPAAPVVAAATTTAPTIAPEAVRNAAEPDAPTPEQIQHLIAVKAKLSPMERKVVLAAIPRMEPTARAQWLAELCALPVDEAAELVRSLLPPLRTGKEQAS